MADDKRRATVFGRAGAPPEMRYAQSGEAVTSVNVAAEIDGETVWYAVKVWGEEAGTEACEKIQKGDWVAAHGGYSEKAGNNKTFRDINAWLIWSTNWYWEKPRAERTGRRLSFNGADGPAPSPKQDAALNPDPAHGLNPEASA